MIFNTANISYSWGNTSFFTIVFFSVSFIQCAVQLPYTEFHHSALFLRGCVCLQKLCVMQPDRLGVNSSSADGFTPLHVAALHGHTALVTLFIRHGANINACNSQNATPLHLACQNSHTQVLLHYYCHSSFSHTCEITFHMVRYSLTLKQQAVTHNHVYTFLIGIPNQSSAQYRFLNSLSVHFFRCFCLYPPLISLIPCFIKMGFKKHTNRVGDLCLFLLVLKSHNRQSYYSY